MSKKPLFFAVYLGDDMLQLYGDYHKPLIIRIPIKQPVQWKVKCLFFVAQLNCSIGTCSMFETTFEILLFITPRIGLSVCLPTWFPLIFMVNVLTVDIPWIRHGLCSYS